MTNLLRQVGRLHSDLNPRDACMNVYVARQPIFKRNKKILGYELLFRDGLSNAFPGIDGESATSKVLSNSFLIHRN